MNKRDEAVLLSFDEEFCLVADNGKERIAILAEWADADLMKKWLIQKLQEEREFGFKAGWKACGEAIIKDMKSK